MKSRRGFTLIEMSIALTVLTIVMVGVFSVSERSQKAFRHSVASSVVNTKANRTMNRIAARLRGAGLATLVPQPVQPFGSEVLSFLEVQGWNDGPLWSEDMQILLEYEPSEIANDVDDDNDGFVDECQVVLVERLGQPDEMRTVLVRDVMEFLEGEAPNGEDDNFNGLEDERGLSFELIGSNLVIRLTVMHRDPEGAVSIRTLETSVALRN